MQTSLNGRVVKLEKRVAPALAEIEQVIDRVTEGSPEIEASRRLNAGMAQPGDEELIYAFWEHETWHGAKLALDARWPRRLWEPVMNDYMYKRMGFLDYADCMACDIWLMDTDPETAASLIPGNNDRLISKPEYGRFCELPEGEREYWRRAAHEEIEARYGGREHTPYVQRLVDVVTRIYHRIKDNEQS